MGMKNVFPTQTLHASLIFCCPVPWFGGEHRRRFPMSKTVRATLSICFFVLGVSLSIEAQDKAISTVSAAAESSNREQDGLNGPVRRVRLETAQVVMKDGKSVEGRRELRGVATYDLHGRKIDSVA